MHWCVINIFTRRGNDSDLRPETYDLRHRPKTLDLRPKTCVTYSIVQIMNTNNDIESLPPPGKNVDSLGIDQHLIRPKRESRPETYSIV
jgi:hypothetical protein